MTSCTGSGYFCFAPTSDGVAVAVQVNLSRPINFKITGTGTILAVKIIKDAGHMLFARTQKAVTLSEERSCDRVSYYSRHDDKAEMRCLNAVKLYVTH